jgi:hypothetical protein
MWGAKTLTEFGAKESIQPLRLCTAAFGPDTSSSAFAGRESFECFAIAGPAPESFSAIPDFVFLTGAFFFSLPNKRPMIPMADSPLRAQLNATNIQEFHACRGRVIVRASWA